MRDKITVFLALLIYFGDILKTIFGMVCIYGLLLSVFPIVQWAVLL